MAIRHKFASAVVDAGNAGEVGPDEWNDDHDHVPMHYLLAAGDGLTVHTNLVAAYAEVLAPRTRTRIDLTRASEVRLAASQGAVGVTGRLRLEYSTDQTTWLAAAAAGQVDLAFGTTANRAIVGAWTALAAGAKADVWVRLMVGAGNTTEDPSWYGVELQVR